MFSLQALVSAIRSPQWWAATNQHPEFCLTLNSTELFRPKVDKQQFRLILGGDVKTIHLQASTAVAWKNLFRGEGRPPRPLQSWSVLKTLKKLRTQNVLCSSQHFRSECRPMQERSHKISWGWWRMTSTQGSPLEAIVQERNTWVDWGGKFWKDLPACLAKSHEEKLNVLAYLLIYTGAVCLANFHFLLINCQTETMQTL